MPNRIKKIALVMLLIPSVVYADRDSQEYKDCSAKYTDAIVQGDGQAFKNHIIECQGKPDADVMSTYSNNSYKQLDPTSLTCLGDINSHGNLNVSYTFYKLAAELGQPNAKASLGLMVEDEDIAKRMDISHELQTEYLNLAQENDAFIFLQVMQLANQAKSRDERQEFQEKYMSEMKVYGQQCVAAFVLDIEKIDTKLANMLEESDEQANRDVDAWVYTEGTMLEDKKQRLNAGLKQFKRMR